jgi:hypothetical protein
MADFKQMIKENPKAAKGLSEMKDIIDSLQALREAGIAKGSDLRPFRGRQSLSDLKPTNTDIARLKVTFGA